MVCSDGGTMSGPDMTPLFQVRGWSVVFALGAVVSNRSRALAQDHARDQLVVNLMETGYPSTMVYHVNTTQYAELVRTKRTLAEVLQS